jgi:hypothetical protein
MLRWAVNYVQKPPPIPPAYIDGFLYVSIALFGFLATAFGSDESAKYISPQALFWLRTICGASSAGLLALKMFRSTTFSEHVAKRESGNTNPPFPTSPKP